MSDIEIGVWVQREGRGGTLGHLVESIINNNVVTRCGRSMPIGPSASHGPLVVIARPLRCYYCK